MKKIYTYKGPKKSFPVFFILTFAAIGIYFLYLGITAAVWYKIIFLSLFGGLVTLFTGFMIWNIIFQNKTFQIILEEDSFTFPSANFSDRYSLMVPITLTKARQFPYEVLLSIDTTDTEKGRFAIATYNTQPNPWLYRIKADWFENEEQFDDFVDTLSKKI